jgi:hypothetical protein
MYSLLIIYEPLLVVSHICRFCGLEALSSLLLSEASSGRYVLRRRRLISSHFDNVVRVCW